MEDNSPRRDIAHGRLNSAVDIIEGTAEEYSDQLSDEDEEELKSALNNLGGVMGSLMTSDDE